MHFQQDILKLFAKILMKLGMRILASMTIIC